MNREKRRIFNSLKTTFFGKKQILKSKKAEVVNKVVTPTLIYDSESWTTTNKD